MIRWWFPVIRYYYYFYNGFLITPSEGLILNYTWLLHTHYLTLLISYNTFFRFCYRTTYPPQSLSLDRINRPNMRSPSTSVSPSPPVNPIERIPSQPPQQTRKADPVPPPVFSPPTPLLSRPSAPTPVRSNSGKVSPSLLF